MGQNQYYSGPGKVFYFSPVTGTVISFQAADTNGAIQVSVDEKTSTRGAAMFGDMFETTTDIIGKVSLTPFSDWGLLPTLFPAFLGVTTAGGTYPGVLSIGTYAHDPTGAYASEEWSMGVFGADLSQYNFVRAAITKHPTVTLGASMPLYSGIELTAIGAYNLLPGTAASGFLMSSANGATTGAPIAEPGTATDPSSAYAFPYTAFTEMHWTGVFGSGITGFSGTLEAEDGWQIVPDIKYNTVTVQKVTRAMVLASARFMIKARLIGATHTSILARVLAHQVGAPLPQSTANQNLLLTSANGAHTVSLYNCEIRGAPFSFGGTKLRTDEICFVTTATTTSSVSTTPSIVFSA